MLGENSHDLAKDKINCHTIESSIDSLQNANGVLFVGIIISSMMSYYYYKKAKDYQCPFCQFHKAPKRLEDSNISLDFSNMEKQPFLENDHPLGSCCLPVSKSKDDDANLVEPENFREMEVNDTNEETDTISSLEEAISLLCRTKSITAMSNKLIFAENEMKCYLEVSTLLINLFKVEMCSFILMTDSEHFTVLECVKVNESSNEIELVESGLQIPLKESAVEYCAATKETIYTPSARNNPYMSQEKIVTDGLNSFLNTPILIAGRKFAGCINVASRKENGFSDNDINLIQDISSTLGAHIYSKRLQKAEREASKVSRELLHSLIPPEVCAEIEHYWSTEKDEATAKFLSSNENRLTKEKIENKERYEEIKDHLELFESLKNDRAHDYDNPILAYSASCDSVQLSGSHNCHSGREMFKCYDYGAPQTDTCMSSNANEQSFINNYDVSSIEDDSISLSHDVISFHPNLFGRECSSIEKQEKHLTSRFENIIRDQFHKLDVDPRTPESPQTSLKSLNFQESISLNALDKQIEDEIKQDSNRFVNSDSVELPNAMSICSYVSELNESSKLQKSMELLHSRAHIQRNDNEILQTKPDDLTDSLSLGNLEVSFEHAEATKKLPKAIDFSSTLGEMPSFTNEIFNEHKDQNNGSDRSYFNLLKETKATGSSRTIKAGSKKSISNIPSSITSDSLNLSEFQLLDAKDRIKEKQEIKRIKSAHKLQNSAELQNLLEGLGHDRKNISTCFTSQDIYPQPRRKSIASSLCKALYAEEASNVSLIFTDIVGFSRISMEVEPIKVMDMLQELFSRFDALCNKHGIFKLETVGDAYVCAAGIFDSSNQNKPDYGMNAAKRALAMAKDMVCEARKVLAPSSLSNEAEYLQIRAGIHIGDVTYGVLGKKTPRLCVFGNAVNMAARMEQTSVPNKIHVTKDFHDIVGESETQWEESRLVSVKNMGEVEAFLLDPFKNIRKLARCA